MKKSRMTRIFIFQAGAGGEYLGHQIFNNNKTLHHDGQILNRWVFCRHAPNNGVEPKPAQEEKDESTIKNIKALTENHNIDSFGNPLDGEGTDFITSHSSYDLHLSLPNVTWYFLTTNNIKLLLLWKICKEIKLKNDITLVDYKIDWLDNLIDMSLVNGIKNVNIIYNLFMRGHRHVFDTYRHHHNEIYDYDNVVIKKSELIVEGYKSKQLVRQFNCPPSSKIIIITENDLDIIKQGLTHLYNEWIAYNLKIIDKFCPHYNFLFAKVV